MTKIKHTQLSGGREAKDKEGGLKDVQRASPSSNIKWIKNL